MITAEVAGRPPGAGGPVPLVFLPNQSRPEPDWEQSFLDLDTLTWLVCGSARKSARKVLRRQARLAYVPQARMAELLDLVRRYRSANDLDTRLQVAEELIAAVGPSLSLFIAGGCPPDVAADVLQNILVGIMAALPRFRGRSTRQVWSLCYTIARRRVADLHRGTYGSQVEPWDPRLLRQLVEDGAASESPAVGTQHDLEEVLELLRRAKPPCYDHLWNHYILGWDYATIARANQISTAAAKVRVRRCLLLAQRLVAKGA